MIRATNYSVWEDDFIAEFADDFLESPMVLVSSTVIVSLMMAEINRTMSVPRRNKG